MIPAALTTMKVLLRIERVSINGFSAGANPAAVDMRKGSGPTWLCLASSTSLQLRLIIIFLFSLESDGHLSILRIEVAARVFDFDGWLALPADNFSPIDPQAEGVRPDVPRVREPREGVLIEHLPHEVDGIAGQVPREIERRLAHDVLVHLHSVLVVVRGQTRQQLVQQGS